MTDVTDDPVVQVESGEIQYCPLCGDRIRDEPVPMAYGCEQCGRIDIAVWDDTPHASINTASAAFDKLETLVFAPLARYLRHVDPEHVGYVLMFWMGVVATFPFTHP